MTTFATSVSVVDGPLRDATALDARLEELRRRFPRAILDRYLDMFAEFAVVLDNQQSRCWASLDHPPSLPRHFFEGCKKPVSAFRVWTHPVWVSAARR